MTWRTYDLDRAAQKLVLKYRHHEVLNESHKMRMAVAYGLERFWGEHLRLRGEKGGEYWKSTWDELASILNDAGILLPNDCVIIQDPPKEKKESKEEKKKREKENSEKINNMANKLWQFAKEKPEENRVALAVLIQLCDCLVWWTQRYKPR